MTIASLYYDVGSAQALGALGIKVASIPGSMLQRAATGARTALGGAGKAVGKGPPPIPAAAMKQTGKAMKPGAVGGGIPKPLQPGGPPGMPTIPAAAKKGPAPGSQTFGFNPQMNQGFAGAGSVQMPMKPPTQYRDSSFEHLMSYMG